MANKIFANGMEVACKAGAGKTICAFPDVCFTPPQTPATPPGVPIPYPNTGMASDTSGGTKKVKISDKEVGIKNQSYFKKSSGDEAGSAPKKGVITSKNMGKVYFNSWSMDVKFEGKNAVRHLDLTTNNHASMPGDTPTWPYLDSMAWPIDTPCKDDAKKVAENCTGDRKKDCPPLDDDKSKNTGYKNNACVKAKRCMLVPYKPKSGCCPGQTPHHLVPKRGFKEVAKYNEDKAPCVCAEGFSWHREEASKFPDAEKTHADLHDLQDYRERQKIKAAPAASKGKAMSYAEARDSGLAAHAAIFPESRCNKNCLKEQLDNYHKEELKVGESDKVITKKAGRQDTADHPAKKFWDDIDAQAAKPRTGF